MKALVSHVKNFIHRPPGLALFPEEIKWHLKAAYTVRAMGTRSTRIMQAMRMEGIPDCGRWCNWVRNTRHSALTGFMNGCALSTQESLTKR